jgi:hypothetical protein
MLFGADEKKVLVFISLTWVISAGYEFGYACAEGGLFLETEDATFAVR